MDQSRPRPGGRSSIYSPRLARVMNRDEMTLFEWIFEDAYLVDVDLSSWTELIALYLVAPHAEERYVGTSWPLFIVELLHVRDLHLTFNHLRQDPGTEVGLRAPLTWRIDNFAVQSVERSLQFTFWGSAEHPRMSVVCESVNIREMPHQIADKLFPGRLEPPYRFIRPGLDDPARDR